ncbi:MULTISPECIES: large-conductance mechanosensitive channel protein MscL [Rossellomorea]|uniref:Large-conductance mechanosensitive channel n=1 Tax=Rossellomorea vietnamensis TaxID=218284 RepID=A0A6I6US26_9BACI|nr:MULTISPECIES: large-conductance mechanosensitive channel protein MscL [Rossellomorea]OXS62140.1 large-conductance mechanosensitive channel [Bacillus sp. DSM 27956]PRX77446.1 large conductance mechanosensitive channel [Bacillus sp. V-88]QHE61833.1 large-conductance mechanosensitive channel protein MscL [Rossellomorea vietnamensis]UTE75970.1 large-conductance mechanosensitive channel protein MscL [Rossellomorea sp. KS-H15a]SLK20242.1 large conductance mechanosensitive channel [Bacillus sp. V-
MWQEFKKFAVKGNVIDLAVAVIIGAAFGKIVKSLVDDIIMPLLGILLGGISFTELKVTVGEAVITYGVFIQNVVDFFLIAFVIFVMVRLYKKIERKEEVKAEVKIDQKEELLREIRDVLKESPNRPS